jgi:hypothetical protein
MERALFECALRVDPAGGSERLAEAIANGGTDAEPDRLMQLRMPSVRTARPRCAGALGGNLREAPATDQV